MRFLTVPNWSFGRSKVLLRQFESALDRTDVTVHYLESDVDHNRTVSAFSGTEDAITESLLELATVAFESIDLNRHVGVHPRIGALDVCPFIPLAEGPEAISAGNALVERIAAHLSGRFALPVFLYERSERGRHEADLPSLRRGGFGSLIGREIHPDFGPAVAHPVLGVTVAGVRDFLIAANVNLQILEPDIAKDIARQIRNLRTEGDPRFLGVRAQGWALSSRNESQVSLNVTLPNLTSLDPIVEYVTQEAAKHNIKFAATELIGVIRPRDLPGATRFSIRPEQIVEAP